MSQLSPYDRAVSQYASSLTKELKALEIDLDHLRVAIRAFKDEEVLEVFVKDHAKTHFQIFKKYKFTATTGQLGPKFKEGDRQIPEGHYFINRFNPKSKFHLSLGLNYPNEEDKKRADKDQPGSDIFIHGSNQTVGCIPIGNEKIRELYLLCDWAKSKGQIHIPVEIYPFEMSKKNINKFSKKFPQHRSFWEKLLASNGSFRIE